VRILPLQLSSHALEISECSLPRDAIAQAANAIQIVAATARFAAVAIEQRHPELRITSGREHKLARQHANNRVSVAVQAYGVADDVGSPAETLLPRAPRQNGDLRAPRLVFARNKVASQNHAHAQRAKESSADAARRHRLRRRSHAQQEARVPIYVQRAERGVHPLPVVVVVAREVGLGNHLRGLGYGHQSVGVRIRQRLDERSIHEAEDGYADAHAESENSDSQQPEPRILAKLAQGVANVLQSRFGAKADDLVALLAHLRCIAELPLCRLARLRRRHAARNQVFLRLRAMKRHLLIQLAAEPAATK